MRYRFDRLLARGTWAVLLWLGALTFVVVLASTTLLVLFGVTFAGSENQSWLEDFWQTLLRILDTGTMAGDVGWGRRVLSLIVTLVGLLLAGTLIGLIAAGIEQRVERLQQGRSMVVESGHYVVLGYSGRLPVVIEQLTTAGADTDRDVVVVMADRDPSAVSKLLRTGVAPAGRSRIVVRSGDPRQPSTLELASIDLARAVVVLADDDDPGDGGVITTVLALGQLIGFDRVPVIAEVSSVRIGEELVRATGPAVHPVAATVAAARVASFVLRQPGLGEIVEELTDAAGSGIYVTEAPEVVGMPFGDLIFRFDRARPIGRVRRDGNVEINPEPSTVFEHGDRLVSIAPERAAVVPSWHGRPAPPGQVIDLSIAPVGMRLLFLGWGRLGPPLLAQFDDFAAPSSTVTIVHDTAVIAHQEIELPAAVNFEVATVPRSDWALSLDADLTSVVLLGASGGSGPDDADGRTLLDLMLVKRMLRAGARPRPQLFVHLVEAGRATLAEVDGIDEFVISDALGSRLLAQFARSPERRRVLLELYAADGPSLHLVSPARLGAADAGDFGDIVAAAASAGLIAIGILRVTDRGTQVVLSPPVADRIELAPDDQIVIVG